MATLTKEQYQEILNRLLQGSVPIKFNIILHTLATASDILISYMEDDLSKIAQLVFGGNGKKLKIPYKEKDIVRNYFTHIKQATNLYIEKIDPNIYTDVTGNNQEYDSMRSDANEMLRLYMLYVDRTAHDAEAAAKVIEFLLSLPSNHIFPEATIKTFRSDR